MSETTPESIPTPPAGIPAVQSFSREQLQAAIEQARQETESRFTSQLTGLTTQFTSAQEQLAALQAKETERETAAKAEADRLAAEQRKAEEDNLSLKELFEKRERENQERFGQMESELARRDAMLEKERQLTALNEYKMQRLSEFQDPDPQNGHPGIAPQLRDLVSGSTPEAIDASISTMVAKTAAILGEMQQLQVQQRGLIPGVSPTAGNIGVMDQQDQTRSYDADAINALPPGSEEHMRLRAQYGLGGNQNHGMFG
jgi:hypothetical protein